jgi:hypothetical protein
MVLIVSHFLACHQVSPATVDEHVAHLYSSARARYVTVIANKRRST